MIQEAQESYKYEHAWLNAVIYNSQGPKENDEPWQISDFISEEQSPEDNEQYTKSWCENFKKRMSLVGEP